MSLNESIVEDAALRDTLLPKLLSGELSVAGGKPLELPDSSTRTRAKP